MATSFAGVIPADAISDVSLMFGSLLDFTWKGVSFPALEFAVELRQDLAIHKFADRDGAHVEATGRAPLQFTARIPFYNGLTPGPAEGWSGALYPTAWKNFFTAAADNKAGVLQHPELGQINCKLVSARTSWNGERRSGVIVEAVWIESDDTGLQFATNLAAPSPLASFTQWAQDADSAVGTSPVPGIPQLPTFPKQFSDLVHDVKSAFDSVTMLQRSVAGKIDAVVYQANSLENSISMAQTSLYWPANRAAEALKSVANDVKATLLNSNKKAVSLYVVQKDSTLSQLASTIPANLSDLMTLNKALVQQPVVPAGTTVRYYSIG